MKFLPFIPYSILILIKIGYFVDVTLEREVDEVVAKTGMQHWNMIIGTYGPQQKLVFQCFNSGESALYIKVGNTNTSDEMKNETKFLSNHYFYQNFKVPELVPINTTGDKFFYQVTKEFIGEKVEPILNEDIICIYKKIAATQSDEKREFSHGDFAPWNIKKTEEGYVVFDWEFCGMRMKGFDLIHYVVSIKMRLENKDFDSSFSEGIIEIKKHIPDFTIEQNEFEREFKKIR